MSGYSYIDPDYTYTDPKSGVMRNKVGIDDNLLLKVFEGLKVTERLEELRAKPLKIKNAETLLDIHKHLFQDIYDWAGKVRTVEISKAGKAFFSLTYFHRAFPFIDSLIAEYRQIDKNNNSDKGDYFKYCGQAFWSFISGDDNLYIDLIEPLGHKARERNEEFQKSYAQMINRFTKQFSNDYCNDDGAINRDKLVRLNSGMAKK